MLSFELKNHCAPVVLSRMTTYGSPKSAGVTLNGILRSGNSHREFPFNEEDMLHSNVSDVLYD